MRRQLARFSRWSASSNRTGHFAASWGLCVTMTRMAFCWRARSSSTDATLSADARSRLPGRLVAEQRGGPADERPGDRRALALAARQRGRPVIRAVGRARPASIRARARAIVVAVCVGDERRNQDVLEHRALRQQAVILEDEADLLVAERRQGGGVERERFSAVERDRARGRRLERAEDVEQRALAAARGSHDRRRVARSERSDTSARTASGPRGVG